MAICQPSPSEAGYATPAALVFCLALSLMAAAAVGRTVATLRLARVDLAAMRTEYGLAGAHLAASAAVVRTAQEPPYHWTFTTDIGWVEAHAEPERDKLSLAAASQLSDDKLRQFGVTSPEALRSRLADASADGLNRLGDVAELDTAPLWRTCAASLISPFGTADQAVVRAPSVPVGGPGPEPQSWRIGETWRLATATEAGWRDDRIVRFTGDARHPTAVVMRRLARVRGDGGVCEPILQAVAAS